MLTAGLKCPYAAIRIAIHNNVIYDVLPLTLETPLCVPESGAAVDMRGVREHQSSADHQPREARLKTSEEHQEGPTRGHGRSAISNPGFPMSNSHVPSTKAIAGAVAYFC